jgi:endoglucanase
VKTTSKNYLWVLLVVLGTLTLGAMESSYGVWRVGHLDERTLLLTGDYSNFIRSHYKAELLPKLKELYSAVGAGWKWDFGFEFGTARLIAAWRPQVSNKLQEFEKITIKGANDSAIALDKAGYWINPTGQARFTDNFGLERLSKNADVAHYLFLCLSSALQAGVEYKISLPTGEVISYCYEPDKIPSELFKINQLGYASEAARKYAYIGAWLGGLGAMPMQKYIDKTFELCDAKSLKKVFVGKLTPRRADEKNNDGTPFTGEETLELDLSDFRQEGRYFLRISGVGRSAEFPISGESVARAFYTHMRGLYHKRCGIAKAKPYTNWTVPICHLDVLRGTFPPENSHYSATGKGEKRDYGFFDENGKSINVNHFELIRLNRDDWKEHISLPGGWHDAADHDRRPFHMAIVGNLSAAYLLRPNNFSDGQLNIPESGNGIADILDEARWGLEHLRRAQQSDGGVGTWIETDHHPHVSEYLPSNDVRPYSLSLATHASSLEYSCYASILSLALQKNGAKEESELYRESARRAWEFATAPTPRISKLYKYRIDKKDTRIYYREPKGLPPEMLLKASFNLSLLYNDSKYLKPLAGMESALKQAIDKRAWSWSPFFLVELELFRNKLTQELDNLRKQQRNGLKRTADDMMKQLEVYAYRIPWYAPEKGFVSHMSWGNYLPLRRALTLLAAEEYTGWKRYRAGAFLANDYHNGANPNGTTLTSGLGTVYPVRFLDLTSYADGIPEFVPGITPYRNTYGIAYDDILLAHGLYNRPRTDQGFEGFKISLLPHALTGGKAIDEKTHAELLRKYWPIWRRWANVEAYSVAASEYTVYETIAPCAVATGLLLDKAYMPAKEDLQRLPTQDITKLPGYAPLP